MWFTARRENMPHDPYRIGLVRKGDNRPDDDPWKDFGCVYVLTVEDAESLGRDLIALAEEIRDERGY